MGNLIIAATFIVLVNVCMWYVSIGMLDINPTGNACFHLEGSIIENSVVRQGNHTVIDNNIVDNLPGPQESVSSGGSNLFTDIFNSILGWFKTAPGIKYVYAVVAAPTNILGCMGLDPAFAVGLGVMWYLITFLVLVAFLWGRGE